MKRKIEREPTKKEIIKELIKGLEESELAQKGKIKLKDARELLKEL